MRHYLSQLYLSPGQIFDLDIFESAHIKANRKNNIGDKVVVKDLANNFFSCKIQSLKKKQLCLQVINKIKLEKPNDSHIHLFCGWLRPKAINFLLQKATELNSSSINFINTQHSLTANKDIALSPPERFNKIIAEACKQCGRNVATKLNFFNSLSSALDHIHQNKYQPWLLDAQGMQNANPPLQQPIAILAGPAGGFSSDEIKQITYPKINLGKLTLRTETALIAALSIFQFQIATKTTS